MSELGSTPKKKCVACGNDIDRDETKCPVCKSNQHPNFCDTCKKTIPESAERCNGCSTYQGKRRHLPFIAAFALFISSIYGLISGGCSGFSYLMDRNSNTKFKVTSSDEQRVYLRVWNTGRKPSTLVGFRLIFDDMPGKEAELELSDKDQPEATNVITSGPPVKIGLSIPLNESIPAARRGKQYTDKERNSLLASRWIDRPLTVEVDVEESDDPCCFGFAWRSHHTRSDRFPAVRISRFMISTWKAAPNDDTPQ